MKHFDTLKKAVLFVAVLFGAGMMHTAFSQTVFTFTNCGTEGQDGPDAAAVAAEYTGTTLDGTVTVLDGFQYWTVPATGPYSIEVYGAQGGDAGGLGARMYGEFNLTGGDELKMIVGQQGGSLDGQHGSGGGGSFVVLAADNSPFIIAGGGGGHGKGSPGINPQSDGSISNDGQSPPGGGPGGVDGGGGAAANGSTGGTATTDGASSISSVWASGGGGLLTDGGIYSGGTLLGGEAFVDGGRGGDPSGGSGNSPGGFGGGGGCGDRAAGGGGYSGGGGGTNNNDGGGGGGSFNIGTAQDNETGVNAGHGLIVITQLCTPLDITFTSDAVCSGDEVTLTAASTSGGTVTWDMGVTSGVPFVPPTGATTYTTTSTSADDCVFTIEITSTDVPTITATATPPSACEGAPITVTGGGGDTYTWTGDGAIDPEDGVPFDSEDGTTTYTVIGSLLGCEGPPASVTVSGASAPSITGVATPTQVCLGESFVLTGEGDAIVYDWGIGIDDGDAITPTSVGTFIYTVIGTNAEGCGDTSLVTVDVLDIPSVDAGIDIAACEGSPVVLNGSGATTYTWDGGVTDGVAFDAILGETTYTVTGTGDNSCSNTDDVVVTGVEGFEITAVVTGEFALFTGAIDVTIVGGVGPFGYTWSHGPVTEDVTGLTEGTYNVMVNDLGVEDGICEEDDSTFTITSFIGIDENTGSVIAYPNPTTDLVTISYAGEFTYEVRTIDGKVVAFGNGVDTESISLESLSKGTYMINVTSGETQARTQIVKQ